MSATDTSNSADTTESEDHEDHPTASKYVNIAVVLAILTAMEVSTYFFDFGAIAVPLLIVLMVIKFLMVAGFFMHLRYDIKVFGQLLYLGLGFALTLYTLVVIILTFEHAPPA